MICAVITHSFRDISKAAWMTAAPVCRPLRAGNAPTSNQLANGSAKQATLPACTQLRQPALRICAFTDCGIRMSAPVNASHLGDRVVRQIDRRMCLADGFLVRAGHEAERFPFL